MSCGNRFQCALRKTSRFQFQPDKPSNTELHNENQKRLNDLLKAREEIDKQFHSVDHSNIQCHIFDTSVSTTPNTIDNTNTTIKNTYTPWTTPSTEYYQIKPK
jgi:hypothetical protein